MSGAISKTINLGADATPDDIKKIYMQSWKMGLKSVTVYRDGCKQHQPLQTEKKAEPTDADNFKWGERKKVPEDAPMIKHKFRVGAFMGTLMIGFYPETYQVGEIWIKASKGGSTVQGLLDTIAKSMSYNIQLGMRVEDLADRFQFERFEPSGFTGKKELPSATSLVDYIVRWIRIHYAEEKQKLMIKERLEKLAEKSEILNAEPVKIEFGDTPGLLLDAPPCDKCGSITTRRGNCYYCENCNTPLGGCS